MAFGRAIGWALIILAVVTLGYDVVAWWHQQPESLTQLGRVGRIGEVHLSAVGEIWFRIDSDSLELAQPAIERHLWPWLWDPVILTVLLWPAYATLLGLGVIFLLLFRRRRRRGGFR